MVMEPSRTTPTSVVSEFEGMLLKNKELFSYFMLLAFDASGLIRFTILLFLWPIIALLDAFSYKDAALKVMIFVATVGLHDQEIVSAARAVLPKFYMDDLSMETWRVFSSCKKKVVVTKMPRVMVERFAKEHLGADEVIGTELTVNRLGFFTGLIQGSDIDQSITNSLSNLFVERMPNLGIGRASTTFLSLCEDQIHEPVHWNHCNQQLEPQSPKPVIFHDGSLVKRPTPATALLILLWLPFGVVLATIRAFLAFFLPIQAMSCILGILGCRIIVKGTLPLAKNSGGRLFVCNHRTLLDPIMVSYVLGRKITIIASYLLSGLLTDILSPVRTVMFTGNRDNDAAKMKQTLSKGDLVVCPEGIYCHQPVVLRFSAMFAELTNKIMPIAVNCRYGFFRSRVRSKNGMRCLMLHLMNPRIVYEITFMNQLPLEDTCSYGKSPYDVANHVQRILADTLRFECTNLGKKDRYKCFG